MYVVLVNGSLARPSHTGALLRDVAERLRAGGCTTAEIDFHQLPLPNALPEFHRNPEDFPSRQVQEWLQLMRRADGVVLGSPLYHGSYSGVLKNALDHLPYDIFRNKPVGLVTNGGGARSGLAACDHLRAVVRTLCGYAAQGQVASCPADYTLIDDALVLTNDAIQSRAQQLAKELIWLMGRLRSETV